MDAAMGSMGLGIVLTLRDQASSGLDKIKNKLSGLQGVTAKMVKDFDAGTKKIMGGIAMMWSGAKVFGTFNNLFGESINIAASFEQAMARVAAVSGATGKDFEKLSAQAKQLGRDTQFSASQAANAQELLARAGFQTNEITAALPDVLNMAAAEGMGLAEAADIAAGTLRGFGLQATEMNTVANILAATSSKTNTSIATLGESFKYAAPHAKALGIELADAAAMIGVMGDASIKGGMAGTALASALRRLATEPAQASKALASLGISAQDALENGSVSIEKLMKLIAGKIGGMNKLQKENILAQIFGGEASSGMLTVMDAVVSGKLSSKRSEIAGAATAAQDMADRMNATYEGAVKRLESASEGLQIAIGNIFIPIKTWLIDKIAAFKSGITGFIETFPFLSKVLIGGAGAVMTLVGSVLTLNGAMMAAQGASKVWRLAMKAAGASVGKFFDLPLLKGFADARILFQDARSWGWGVSKSFKYAFTILKENAVSSFKGILQAIWSVPGPIKILIGLAGLLYAAYKTNFAGLRDMFTAISAGWDFAAAASADGIAEIDEATAQSLEKAGLWDLAQNMGKVFFRLREFVTGFKEGIAEAFDAISNVFSSIGNVFKPFITGGTACLKLLGILSPVVETQASTWKTVGKWVGYAVSAIVPLIAAYKAVKLAAVAWTAAQTALNLVMNANPIGLIITGIAALVAAGYWLYSNWDAVCNAIAAAWDWVCDAIAGAWEWIKGLFSFDWIIAGWNAAVQGISAGWNWICDAVAAGWEWLKGLFSFDWLSDTWNAAIENISAGWDWLKSIIVPDWLVGFWDSLTAGWNKFIKIIKGGWNKFKNIFTLQGLKDLWQEIVTGFNNAIAWIKQGWESVKSWLVPDWLKGLWNGLVAGWEKAKAFVEQGWEKFKSFFKLENLLNVWDSLKAGWNAAKDWVIKGWENFKSLFKLENLIAVWDSLKTGWETAKNAVQQGWQDLKAWIASFIPNWISNPWTSLIGWLDEVIDSIKQKWRDFKKWLTDFIPDWFKSWVGIPTEAAEAVNLNLSAKSMPAFSSNEEEQKVLQAQTKDLTILNKMYEGFRDKIAEMTAAWEPFKKSLGEGFENIYNIMKQVGDNIRTHVITAVNELISSLKLLSAGLADVARAGSINVQLPKNQVQEHNRAIQAAGNIGRFDAHAAGGIFTQPHLGLVAEEGPEAVIPLNDPTKGMPLLNAAADILGMRNFTMPEFKENASAGILSSLSRGNQSENLNQQSSERRGQSQSQITNNMNVKMEAVTTPVYLDGDLIGEFITRFFEHQDMRSGVPELA